MRAILLTLCLFAVAACVAPAAAPVTTPEASSAPSQEAGSYTVVITPPTAAHSQDRGFSPGHVTADRPGLNPGKNPCAASA